MSDLIVRGSALLDHADYPKDEPNKPEVGAEKAQSKDEVVHGATAAQIDALVEDGELTAKDVYDAESKAEKPRKGILDKYKSADEAKSE